MPAATALHDVTPATLKAWLERAEAILVDVREADEYAREPIAGARRHPLSPLMAAPLARVQEKKLVLQCHSGSRTRQAAAAILARAGQEARAPLQQRQPDAPGCGGDPRARARSSSTTAQGGIQARKRDGPPIEVRPRGGTHERGRRPMQVTTIGLDIAKHVFQVHGVDRHGKVVLRKRLRRVQVLAFFANLPPCRIGLEACGGAHYWARAERARA
jgi:rhodanese-related sulfurtransferase